MKIYSKDNKKYGGDPYNILETKLRYFYDYCAKISVTDSQYDLAFLVILKGRTADFYNDKITGRNYLFHKMEVDSSGYKYNCWGLVRSWYKAPQGGHSAKP